MLSGEGLDSRKQVESPLLRRHPLRVSYKELSTEKKVTEDNQGLMTSRSP